MFLINYIPEKEIFVSGILSEESQSGFFYIVQFICTHLDVMMDSLL